MTYPEHSDPPSNVSSGDWGKYAYHILHQLKEGKREREQLQKQVHAIHIQLAAVRAKASVWGTVAGSLAGLATLALDLLIEYLKQ